MHVSARLDEGNELPGVGNRRGNGGTSGNRGSPSSSSRSQNRIFQGHEDDKSMFHQGHLPQESSLRYSRSLPYSVTPDQKGNPGRRMRNDEGIVDDDTDCHFSFYKWASNGIPVLKLMHILDGNCMKSKKGDVVVGAPQFSRTGPEKKDARTQRGARKNLEDFFRETLDGVYDLKVSGVDDESVITNAEDMEGAKGETELAEAFSQFADTRDLTDVLRESQDERTEVVNSSHSRSAAAAANTPKERWDAEWQRDADHKPDDSSKASENLKCEKEEKRSAASSREMLYPDTVCSPESDIDPFEVNFMVEVLSEDPETVAPPTKIESTKIRSCISDSVQEIDAKIRNWSAGKKGNIQSLLSTLQFVLWPGSGWKPVPLVDLLEANSIRRAYQKAMLQLHPDKLQQRSAAFHQKYLAEKVFEILQEAWDHFSTVAHV